MPSECGPSNLVVLVLVGLNSQWFLAAPLFAIHFFLSQHDQFENTFELKPEWSVLECTLTQLISELRDVKQNWPSLELGFLIGDWPSSLNQSLLWQIKQTNCSIPELPFISLVFKFQASRHLCKDKVFKKECLVSLYRMFLFCFVTEEILSITAVSKDRGSYAKPHATGFP